MTIVWSRHSVRIERTTRSPMALRPTRSGVVTARPPAPEHVRELLETDRSFFPNGTRRQRHAGGPDANATRALCCCPDWLTHCTVTMSPGL